MLQAEAQGPRRIRTLVVDDAPVALRSICSFLTSQSAVEIIATAMDGREALALVERLRPDVVLMDLQMPGINGLDATSHIALNFPGTLVIMVTVHDTPELRRACQESGAYGFVAKNQLSWELPAVLKRVLSGRALGGEGKPAASYDPSEGTN